MYIGTNKSRSLLYLVTFLQDLLVLDSLHCHRPLAIRGIKPLPV